MTPLLQFQYVFRIILTGVIVTAVACSGASEDAKGDQIEPKREFHPAVMDREGSTLVAGFDTGYVYQPLGCFPDPDSIQLLNGNIFSVSDSADYYTKLVYGNSVIVLIHNGSISGAEESAEYRHQQPDEWEIWRATIRDEKIQLASGIQLGMEISDFVSRYVTSDTVDLAGINVIHLREPFGEFVEAEYRFADDRLKEIVIGIPW